MLGGGGVTILLTGPQLGQGMQPIQSLCAEPQQVKTVTTGFTLTILLQKGRMDLEALFYTNQLLEVNFSWIC